MENGAIADGQITASSIWEAIREGFMARLHLQELLPINSGCWLVRTNDGTQWLQVDLGDNFTSVTSVATQGRNGHCCQWVSQYNLQYSDDGVTFQYYQNEQGQTRVLHHFCFNF